MLMDLINQTYLDRVERIDGAQVDDADNIICAATDGRKALAVRVTDSDIDIRLIPRGASTPQFAAPSKKKNCKTGISCGMSCISASKTCSKKTTPRQKAQKQKIAADAKGGALVPTGGKLANTEAKKAQKEERSQSGTVNDRIDDKYASANPSDQDVANYIEERVKAHFEPTAENIAQRAAKEAQRSLWLDEVGRSDVKQGQFSKRVKDRDSYAKARVAQEEWDRKKNPQDLVRRADPEHWFRSIRSEGRLNEADLAKTQKQVAKGSAAAEKKLAKHNAAVAAEPVERARAKEIAARHQAEQGRSKAERLNEYKKKFDETESANKQRMERDWEPIKTGKKTALTDAKHEAFASEIPRRESAKKRGTYEPMNDNDIKEHLIGLSKKRDTQMFSGTKADIRKQYRELAAKFHPDNQSTGNEREFRRVTDAYNEKIQELD